MPPKEDDIIRLHEKVEHTTGKNQQRIEDLRAEFNMHVNSINGSLGQMSTSVAVMAERFKQLRQVVDNFPPQKPRPCDYFVAHEKQHEKADAKAEAAKTIWKKPIVGCIVDLIKMGIVFLIAFFWGVHKK